MINNFELENRLKTLEEDNALQKKMIKFIMDNSYWSLIDNLSAEVDDSKERKSLQDLYDEENEPKISDIGEIEKHSTCKHTPIYSGKCCEECKPTVKDNWRCGKCEIEESGYQSGESIPEHSIHCKKRNEPTVKECKHDCFKDESGIHCKKCKYDWLFTTKKEPTDNSEKIEEDFYQEQNKRIREQIRDLKIQNANLDDYFINNREEVVKGRPDVKTGRLYGLDCGYIDGSRDKKIEEIIGRVLENCFKPSTNLESWLRDKLKNL